VVDVFEDQVEAAVGRELERGGGGGGEEKWWELGVEGRREREPGVGVAAQMAGVLKRVG
jgi:hypothetical protein